MIKQSNCCLGSLNLYEFVEDKFTPQANFNVEKFIEAIGIATNALDTIIDENAERLPKEMQAYKDNAYNWRNIGLGVFNYAHMLMALNLTYGSSAAIAFTDELFQIMAATALTINVVRGLEKGSFPNFKEGIIEQSKMYSNLYSFKNEIKALRNCTLLSIAPTGSIATMLGGSGGIEPEFALSYTRRTDNLNEEYKIDSNIVKEYKRITGKSELPEYFVSSKDIKWQDRVNTQATIQQYIDTAISSTINLPEETPLEEIEQLYLYAWQKGLKGVTIFRDGCKRTGILTTKEKEEKTLKDSTGLLRGEVISINDTDAIGFKRSIMSGCVDSETEFFTGKGWKKISEYTQGDKVLQYNIDGTTTLVEPLNYIKRPSQGQYHIETKYGLDMMVSPDHRNVTFHKGNDPKIMTTQEIISTHDSTKTGFTRKFKTTFDYDGEGIKLSDDEIRLSIAIFADGCFYSPTSKKCLISVRKRRKRDRLIEILNRLNLRYSEKTDNRGYYKIKFYPPLPGKVKLYPEEWYGCSKEQLKVIFDEVFHWDGYEKENNQYTTIHKSNADFIQFVCTSLGFRSSIYKDKRHKNTTYRVDWTSRTLCSLYQKPKKDFPFVIPADGYDYCFSVPSTMLVLRRNDKIFVTGNCGRIHCTAFFDVNSGDLVETYFSKGSTGGCNNYMIGLSRMISLAARGGISIEDIVDQLMSTGSCPSYAARSATKHDTSKGSCCPMAIGYALKEMWEEFQGKEMKPKETVSLSQKITVQTTKPTCPECGGELQFEGGCNICHECGYSKCS